MGRLGPGERTALNKSRSLAGIAWFHVESEHSGYVVVIRGGGSGATALTRAVAAQSHARRTPARPGRSASKGGAVTARVAPARTADEARAIAARLV